MPPKPQNDKPRTGAIPLHSIMFPPAAAIVLIGRRSIKQTKLACIKLLIPNTSLFSTLCKRQPISPSLVPPPPVPKKVPFAVSVHGTTWQDPYHWMRNKDDPDFINYLHQENSYAQAFMSDTNKLQQTLYSEMTSRMPSTVSVPPIRLGPWLYYLYIPKDKEYPVLCRKKKGWVETLVDYVWEGVGKEEVLLDWNEIAEQYGYVHVGVYQVSPDHKFLAYTIDVTGGEWFILKVKDLRSGTLQNLGVSGVVNLEWSRDGSTLFYTVADDTQRPYRVRYTKLGADPMEEMSLYTETDPSFCVDITSTKDRNFITVYVLDQNHLQDGLQRIHKRVPGVQYFLEHHNGFFYILTNMPLSEDNRFSTGNYYLARCRVEDVKSANWENIILPTEDTSIRDMDIFNEHLVLFLNRKGSSVMCAIRMPIDGSYKKEMQIDDLNPWYFPLPSDSCGITPGLNPDFMSSRYQAVISSPVIPDLFVDYDMSRRTFSILHQNEVPSISRSSGSSSMFCLGENYDMTNPKSSKDKDVTHNEVKEWRSLSNTYCCETKEVVSRDGTRIPLTILYSQKAHQRAQSPGILEGYGAYGETLDKTWCVDRLSLLDRGWVVAFADVRGGGGADSSWHTFGKGLYKSNSIFDFVSCGEYLINEGYVHTSRLGAVGRSAGSLLASAASNMYPELFRAIILNVPFLDICNTLLDPSLPLTRLDYEEFGSPQIQPEFQSIMSYSPYDNVPDKVCCPAMLVTASFNDARVGVWEAAKWVAKVREKACPECSLSVILKTNMSGGHFGEGGRFSQLEESAYEYAFLMKAMDLYDKE